MPGKLPRPPALVAGAVIVLASTLAWLPAMASEDPAVLADTTPTRVLSVVSGGYWEAKAQAPESEDKTEGDDAAKAEAPQTGDNAESDDAAKTEAAEAPADKRGYYRSLAIRSADNTSRLYLQRIWLSEDGPVLLDTREITALTELKAYITDMRPENSTGVAKQHGFVTYVYLKQDPRAEEPDTWELYVDDFGDAAFTPASN